MGTPSRISLLLGVFWQIASMIPFQYYYFGAGSPAILLFYGALCLPSWKTVVSSLSRPTDAILYL
jgi:hypothetical protein